MRLERSLEDLQVFFHRLGKDRESGKETINRERSDGVGEGDSKIKKEGGGTLPEE